jgi:head-tail adaptor
MASRQTRVRMRYRNDIDSSMRVTIHQDASVIYQIISGPVDVTSEGRKRMIEFVCEKLSTVGDGL